MLLVAERHAARAGGERGVGRAWMLLDVGRVAGGPAAGVGRHQVQVVKVLKAVVVVHVTVHRRRSVGPI